MTPLGESAEDRIARTVNELLHLRVAPTPMAQPQTLQPQVTGGALPAPAKRKTQTRGGRTVAVGDSLGVGTTPYLKTAGSDTRVGRSSASAVDALKRLVGPGVARVLFDAGTNDGNAAQLKQSLQRARKVAGGAAIYVPTVNGPQAAAKNAVIRQMAARGQIQMVDWASRSRGLVGGDGIHASPQGYKQRAALIRRAMGE